MRDKRTLRAWIGAVAAYAIALQVLLTPALGIQMTLASSSDPAAICASGIHDSGQQRPANPTHPAHEACILCAFVSAAGLPPSALRVALMRTGEAGASWRPLNASVHLARRRSPQIPQGPPQAASPA